MASAPLQRSIMPETDADKYHYGEGPRRLKFSALPFRLLAKICIYNGRIKSFL
jgi:hypothetical protein